MLGGLGGCGDDRAKGSCIFEPQTEGVITVSLAVITPLFLLAIAGEKVLMFALPANTKTAGLDAGKT